MDSFEREWEGIGVYAGHCVDHGDQKQAHGFGTFSYANGDVYKGEWRDGQRHGKGRLEAAEPEMVGSVFQRVLADLGPTLRTTRLPGVPGSAP